MIMSEINLEMLKEQAIKESEAVIASVRDGNSASGFSVYAKKYFPTTSDALEFLNTHHINPNDVVSLIKRNEVASKYEYELIFFDRIKSEKYSVVDEKMDHFTKYCKPAVLAEEWKDDKRPSKDEYYLGFAKAAAIRGTCLRRNYGAVIVKNDEIVSTGYTGAPRGRHNCNEIGRCVRMEKGIPSGQRYEMCRSVHAEMNAIISASRDKMIGATLYLYGWDVEHNCEKTDPVPCSLCERMIINAGIEEVVALNPLYTEGGKEPKIYHYKVKDYIKYDESLQYLIETAESK